MAARLGKIRTAAAAGATFLRLFLIPSKSNRLPENIRLVPSW
jgi:hypothetical protein